MKKLSRISVMVVLATMMVTSLSEASTRQLVVPMFDQKDKNWDVGVFATCGASDTFANTGCLITSLAMVYNYYEFGYTDPKKLYYDLVDHDQFVACDDGCGCFKWEYFGSPNNFDEARNKKEASHTDLVNQYLAEGKPVIAKVKNRDRNIDFHFVVLTGQNGDSDYYINDPIDGKYTTISAQDYTIERFELFNGWDGDLAPVAMFQDGWNSEKSPLFSDAYSTHGSSSFFGAPWNNPVDGGDETDPEGKYVHLWGETWVQDFWNEEENRWSMLILNEEKNNNFT